MDDIQTRLQETSQSCLEAYTAWIEDKKNSKAQEGLSSAIHELRKVSSRIEIELAISEREQITSKPLPIPSHRANNRKATGASADASDMGAEPVVQQKTQNKRRRTPRPDQPAKKSE